MKAQPPQKAALLLDRRPGTVSKVALRLKNAHGIENNAIVELRADPNYHWKSDPVNVATAVRGVGRKILIVDVTRQSIQNEEVTVGDEGIVAVWITIDNPTSDTSDALGDVDVALVP